MLISESQFLENSVLVFSHVASDPTLSQAIFINSHVLESGSVTQKPRAIAVWYGLPPEMDIRLNRLQIINNVRLLLGVSMTSCDMITTIEFVYLYENTKFTS